MAESYDELARLSRATSSAAGSGIVGTGPGVNPRLRGRAGVLYGVEDASTSTALKVGEQASCKAAQVQDEKES